MGDLRLALRTLRRAPAYALTVVLTLALGIGGATAVYGILHSVILRPLPYAPADRVMLLAERDSAGGSGSPARRPASRVPGLRGSASLQESLAYRRFITGLLAAFAVPAVLLAALGIYGVVAYLVTQRSREMGIRMALGAQRRNVLGLVLGEGMRLAAIGLAIGGVGAAVATRWLRAQLYQVSATDPATFVAAAVLLAAIAALATLLSAWRATGIDPAGTLKTE